MLRRHTVHPFVALLGAVTLASPAAAQSVPSQCDAVAGNLVANCGFEAGNIAPAWTAIANQGAVTSTPSNSGTYAAFFGLSGGFQQSDGYGAIEQTLATTAGQTYSISFFGLNTATTDAHNDLRILFGGVTVFDQALTSATNTGFQQYTVSGVATGANTTLTVEGYSVYDNADAVDDFVVRASGTGVTTTPEPSTWALLGAGLVAIGGAARRRRGAMA